MSKVVEPAAVRKLKSLLAKLGITPSLKSVQSLEGWSCVAMAVVESETFEATGKGFTKNDAKEEAAKALSVKLKVNGVAAKAIPSPKRVGRLQGRF